jgi:hypothetical protein
MLPLFSATKDVRKSRGKDRRMFWLTMALIFSIILFFTKKQKEIVVLKNYLYDQPTNKQFLFLGLNFSYLLDKKTRENDMPRFYPHEWDDHDSQTF